MRNWLGGASPSADRFRSAVGLVGWLLACLLPLDGSGVGWLAARFILLAVLVWVPLAISLFDEAETTSLPRLLRWLYPWCAGVLVASFVLPAGLTAASLAVPWALWTGLLGLRGLLRLWQERTERFQAPEELCLDLGMLALPVGGIWLLAARAGLPLLGFVYPITLLTAMHFHYAGLLMPTVVGLAGRLLPVQAPGWPLYRVLAPAVCLGVWMVAVGITAGGLVEALAGTIFATLLAAVSAILLSHVAAQIEDDPLARALLLLSLLATWPAMGLAALYALSHAGLTSVSLETMAMLHGTLLAVVFVGGGLTALARLRPAAKAPAHP
ncbi:MAG: YndJ family transporter [Chloroflexota bacterium]